MHLPNEEGAIVENRGANTQYMFSRHSLPMVEDTYYGVWAKLGRKTKGTKEKTDFFSNKREKRRADVTFRHRILISEEKD